MAADFSFIFEFPSANIENSCATFKSPDGEEYTMKFVHSTNMYYNNYKKLVIQWITNSSKIITVTRYDVENRNFSNVACELVKNSTSLGINMPVPSNRPTIVLRVNVTPTVLINDNAKKNVAANITPKQKPVMEKKLDQLSEDMKNLFLTGDLSDIVLTDGKNEISAHKIVLSMRSTVFAKMLKHPMKETLENRIFIKDISIPVLKELLNFMYSGTILIKDAKMARDLYIAADKYAVTELRNICSEIIKKVDCNTVLDALLLADLHDDKALKNAALVFISQNYSDVKALQDWNRFLKDNQPLAIEILTFVIDKKH